MGNAQPQRFHRQSDSQQGQVKVEFISCRRKPIFSFREAYFNENCAFLENMLKFAMWLFSRYFLSALRLSIGWLARNAAFGYNPKNFLSLHVLTICGISMDRRKYCLWQT